VAEERHVLFRRRHVLRRSYFGNREFAALNASALAIDARALAKRYRGIEAVADLSIGVGTGEIFGFLGPNGAGKTTSVKMLLGLVFPTGGTATVLGKPLGDRGARRAVGYLPELFRYQEWLSAREVLAYHATLLKLDAPSRAIDAVIDTVGLGGRGDDRVGTFSKGMQQRLGLAVALLGDPQLIILDEPTSALDPLGRREVRDVLLMLRERHVTVFLNSHLLTEVERICDRVAIVDRGRVVAQGPIASIVGDSQAVRIRAEGDRATLETVAAPFGSVTSDDGWLTIDGIANEKIADAVSALVAAGARISAVEPMHATLEDRFLELVRER
jgi:ABC-2 type transport system ATP-binding protein